LLQTFFGFVGYIRIVSPEHTIILSKPDNPADDLRLANPFPELSKFADSVDMAVLNSQEHSHVPFLVILLQLAKKWKEQHGGKLPETSSEKSAFKSEILKGSRSSNEVNFSEAYKSHFKATTPSRISSTVQAILNDPKATNITAQSSDFWVIAAAVKEFVQHEGAGMLPLMGSIPDMTATTTGYITLQKIFQEKANQDVEEVSKRVRAHLQKVGRSETSISADDIKLFCKNAHFLQVIRYRSLEEEYNPSTAKSSELASKVVSDTNVIWYIMLRAARRFYTQHHRHPGTSDSQLSGDVTIMKKIVEELCAELKITTSIEEKYIYEIVRVGAAELHTMASFIGGVASQEIIKLITHQYVPMDNTFIYNGGNSTSTTIVL